MRGTDLGMLCVCFIKNRLQILAVDMEKNGEISHGAILDDQSESRRMLHLSVPEASEVFLPGRNFRRQKNLISSKSTSNSGEWFNYFQEDE